MATQPEIGKIVYNLKSFFPNEVSLFVADGRKYVRLVNSSIARCVAIADNGRHVYLEPLWSQEEVGKPMQLEAVVTKEVVTETEAADEMKGTNDLVRSHHVLTRSSQENPREIILEKLPRESWITINTMFPKEGSIAELSRIAFDELNQYDLNVPLGEPCFPKSDAEAYGEKKKCQRAASADGGLHTKKESDTDVDGDKENNPGTAAEDRGAHPCFPKSDAEAYGEKKKSQGEAAADGGSHKKKEKRSHIEVGRGKENNPEMAAKDRGDSGYYTTEEDDDDADISKPKIRRKAGMRI